jgi:hypothetical protein
MLEWGDTTTTPPRRYTTLEGIVVVEMVIPARPLVARPSTGMGSDGEEATGGGGGAKGHNGAEMEQQVVHVFLQQHSQVLVLLRLRAKHPPEE